MIESRAAHRYAKAILDLAREQGKIDEYVEDFQTLEYAIEESRELQLLLDRPTVPAETKGTLLRALFEGKVSDGTLRFLQLMATKGRSNLVRGTVQSFNRQLAVERGIETAVIRSAQELEPGLRGAIEAKLSSITGSRIDAVYSVDPELIGGFTARVGDRMIDASVRHQLERLHETLSEETSAWTPSM